MTNSTTTPTSLDSKLPTVAEWKAIVAKFQRPSISRATWQIINSVIPYCAIWALMAWSMCGPYWMTLLLALLNGLFVVRIFIIFHDCGHGSFFKSQARQRHHRLHHRRADLHALFPLALGARPPPRHLRRPGPPRRRATSGR